MLRGRKGGVSCSIERGRYPLFSLVSPDEVSVPVLLAHVAAANQLFSRVACDGRDAFFIIVTCHSVSIISKVIPLVLDHVLPPIKSNAARLVKESRLKNLTC